MHTLAAGHDTTTQGYDPKRLWQWALALVAGHEGYSDPEDPLRKRLPPEYNEAVEWLRQHENQQSQLASIIRDAANTSSEFVELALMATRKFDRLSNVEDMAQAFEAGQVLDRPVSTLCLAQAIADMPESSDDEESVSRWAERLASDIGRGED